MLDMAKTCFLGFSLFGGFWFYLYGALNKLMSQPTNDLYFSSAKQYQAFTYL